MIEEFAESPGSDLLVTAPTATGKTEAVFLPLLSELMGESLPHGFEVLYICPLKTLINQHAGIPTKTHILNLLHRLTSTAFVFCTTTQSGW